MRTCRLHCSGLGWAAKPKPRLIISAPLPCVPPSRAHATFVAMGRYGPPVPSGAWNCRLSPATQARMLLSSHGRPGWALCHVLEPGASLSSTCISAHTIPSLL
ncbi:hypothetical protein AMTR_s00167p00061370 [Amborella trichopoda]|uniref:Uncharacterized protein n=1 Tax=Amborella trichopoda TaxID=13333 RepID=W1PT49_AMBTC|nr:hypothetical protein AMTR_s00167p00061370 [Amborella trichopoda]